MPDTNVSFEKYLSTRFERLHSPIQRRKKQDWISYNYKRLFPADRSARILEIGPGHGELLEYLCAREKYTRVSAIDLCDEVVVLCNDLVPGSTERVSNTGEFLDKHPNTFDFVIMLQVLEHVPKSETYHLLRAAARSLTDSGRLVVEVPNVANPLLGSALRYCDFTHEVGYTSDSLHYILSLAGFSDISIGAPGIPRVSVPRYAQAALQGLLNGLFALASKVYWPTGECIMAPNIFAVARRRAAGS